MADEGVARRSRQGGHRDASQRLRDRTTVTTPRPVAALGRLAGKVTGRVVETVPPDLILDHIDVDALVDRVDMNRILDRVDVNHLLDRLDLDRVLDRVDPNHILDRVDPNRLLDRIDPNRLIERIDLDELLRSVDVEALVRRSGVPGLVVESQTQLAGSLLDLIRRQLAGLDAVLDRVVNRLLRRDVGSQPTTPRLLEVRE